MNDGEASPATGKTALSAAAPEYIPSNSTPQKKQKKTKEERGPRRRRRKKTQPDSCSGSEFDFDTSDLTEKRSQGSQSRRGSFSRSRYSAGGKTFPEGDYMDFFGSLIGLGTSASLDLSDDLFASPPGGSVSQDPTSSEWLALQAEWVVSKQQSLIDIEYQAEAAERKKWSEWAMYAAERERRRRMLILEEMELAELRERQKRQKWASSAIERERNERMSTQFLTDLTATNWFNEMITTYAADYDVVCPYYKLGCRAICRKTDIEKHMKECKFAVELATALNKEIVVRNYEVVCPNSVLGCPYIGEKQALAKHLDESCEYKGKTRQQENEERQMLKEFVISECEEERERRVNDYDSDDSGPPHEGNKGPPTAVTETGTSSAVAKSTSSETRDSVSAPESNDKDRGGGKGAVKKDRRKDFERNGRKASLQRFMETQMQTVVLGLHEEVKSFWYNLQREQQRRRPGEQAIVDTLRESVQRIWPFSTLEVFGSWATGLPGSGSDIDLVVCFSDECHSLPAITGVVPLLQGLANFLEKDVNDVIAIKQVLLHTRVPLIKGEARVFIDAVTGEPVTADRDNAEELVVSVDISIDGPEHSGLATTAVIESVLRKLPGIGPVSTVLKEYLKINGLCDAYSGGLPSYGVVLLVLLLFLRRHQATQILNTHTLPGELPKLLEMPSASLHSHVTLPPTQPSSSSTPERPNRKHLNSDTTCVTSTSSTPNHSDTYTTFPKTPPRRLRRQSEGQAPHDRDVQSPEQKYPYNAARSAHWTSVEAQKDFGRRVAFKLLSPTGGETNSLIQEAPGVCSPRSPMESFDSSGADYSSADLNAAIDELGSPILGVVVVEFLGFYGDALECGRHGFSVRDGGFRFEVRGSGPEGAPAHPQAAHPIVIEDPVNVMNNVAKNCYNAASVQRAFVGANERFKNTVTRYSGRAGSALAGGVSKTRRGFIKDIFGLDVDGSDRSSRASSTDAPMSGEDSSASRASAFYEKFHDTDERKTMTKLSKAAGEAQEGSWQRDDEACTQATTELGTLSTDSYNPLECGSSDGSLAQGISQDVEYRKALNDMLLLKLFDQSRLPSSSSAAAAKCSDITIPDH